MGWQEIYFGVYGKMVQFCCLMMWGWRLLVVLSDGLFQFLVDCFVVVGGKGVVVGFKDDKGIYCYIVVGGEDLCVVDVEVVMVKFVIYCGEQVRVIWVLDKNFCIVVGGL